MGNGGAKVYEVEAESTTPREGKLRSRDLPALDVAAPPEFQGPGGAWTPEHLLVASVNACFMFTFRVIAENSNLSVVSFCSSAWGKFEKIEGIGYQMTEVVIRPRLVIRDAVDLGRTDRILQKAKTSCLISNSIKGELKLEPEIFHEQNPVYPCPPVADPHMTPRRE